MKKINWRRNTFLALAAGTGIFSMAAHADVSATSRDFCSARGGQVVETENAELHLCCYTQRQMCMSVNDRTRTSLRVRLPEHLGSAQGKINTATLVSLPPQ